MGAEEKWDCFLNNRGKKVIFHEKRILDVHYLPLSCMLVNMAGAEIIMSEFTAHNQKNSLKNK